MEPASMEQFIRIGWQIWLINTLWVLPWKGVALWKAAKLRQTKWFIAILVLNTLAILDIFYIFAIAKKKEKESQEAR